MENKQYKIDESQLGVLWEKQAASGIKYFSGVLNLIETGKINIVIFKNNGKSEKAPTHIILKSKPREKIEKVEETRTEYPETNIEEDIKADLFPF